MELELHAWGIYNQKEQLYVEDVDGEDVSWSLDPEFALSFSSEGEAQLYAKQLQRSLNSGGGSSKVRLEAREFPRGER